MQLPQVCEVSPFTVSEAVYGMVLFPAGKEVIVQKADTDTTGQLLLRNCFRTFSWAKSSLAAKSAFSEISSIMFSFPQETDGVCAIHGTCLMASSVPFHRTKLIFSLKSPAFKLYLVDLKA